MTERQNQMVRFQDVAVMLHEHDGQMWMTGEDIGRCLGYADPRRSVKTIYSRHKDELKDVSRGIKLIPLDEKSQVTRVYNEQGAYLIAMFAKTDRAKDLRAWLANLPITLREISAKPNDGGFAVEQVMAVMEKISGAMERVALHVENLDRRMTGVDDRMTGLERRVAALEAPSLRISSGSNHVRTFLDDACVMEPDALTLPMDLYENYRQWCYAAGHAPLGKNHFYGRLRDKNPQLRKRRYGSRDFFEGIKPTDPEMIPTAPRPSYAGFTPGPAGNDVGLDMITSFIQDCCLVSFGVTVVKTQVYDAYCQWCMENGHHPDKQSYFFGYLKRALPHIKETKSYYGHHDDRPIVFRGMSLRAEYRKGGAA